MPEETQHPSSPAQPEAAASCSAMLTHLHEENRSLKDQLATLSETHAEDRQRLSDMIDKRDNALRAIRAGARLTSGELQAIARNALTRTEGRIIHSLRHDEPAWFGGDPPELTQNATSPSVGATETKP